MHKTYLRDFDSIHRAGEEEAGFDAVMLLADQKT